MIQARLRESLRDRDLVRPGDRILAAVSGGPDSMALLHLLLELGPEIGLSLAVAHLDHGLRGEAGREDARFVEEFARARGLPVAVRRVDARGHARRAGGGLEAAARELRYRFLEEAAVEAGAASVATGHTADDLAETLLLFLIRGAGDAGLGGFPWKRPLGRGLSLIRPLRNIRREELIRYLAAHNIPFREDVTNADLRHPRNRIRREIIPLIERSLNRRAVEALCRSADRWSESDDLLSALTTGALESALARQEAGKITLDAPRSGRYHVCLRGRVLRAAFGLLSSRPLSEFHTGSLLRLLGAPGGEADLPDGIRAARRGDSLILERVASGGTGRGADRGYGEEAAGDGRVLSVPGLIHLGEVETHRPGEGRAVSRPASLRSRLMEEGEGVGLPRRGPRAPEEGGGGSAGPGPLRVFMDWHAILPPLKVRHPRPGDRMRPLGMRGTRKLQDILVDDKIPRRERPGLWIVEDRRRILWVVGVRRSEEAKLTRGTRRILVLEGVEA